MFPAGLFGKWQAGCLVKRFQVAKIIEHCCRSAEILIAGVVIDGDVGLDACGEAGAQAVIGVFQRDAITWGEAEVIQHPVVNIRCGFLVRHDVATSDAGKIALPILAQAHFEKCSNVLQRGGSGYGELDVARARIIDELLNAGAQGNVSVGQHGSVMPATECRCLTKPS